MGKIGEKFLIGPKCINSLAIGFKEIGVVSVGKFGTFEKLGFPFYTSYCHLKTVPPMNIFDFFTLNQLRKSGPFHIWPFWPYMNFPR